MDVHSPTQRSYNMSCIKGENTRPEEMIRHLLWSKGYRYRLHYKKLPGKPDVVFPSRKKVIFIHGCFWHRHRCKYFKWPATNSEFWKKKIMSNVARDKKNVISLTDAGWKHLIIWECETKAKNRIKLWLKIEKFLLN
jgi:DNA mismatch endonuclease, patch repair protein